MAIRTSFTARPSAGGIEGTIHPKVQVKQDDFVNAVVSELLNGNTAVANNRRNVERELMRYTSYRAHWELGQWRKKLACRPDVQNRQHFEALLADARREVLRLYPEFAP